MNCKFQKTENMKTYNWRSCWNSFYLFLVIILGIKRYLQIMFLCV